MKVEKENKIVVSDEFVNIYKNFNILSQVDEMNKLDKRELYLLLTFSLDKHSDEDPVVVFNFKEFEDKVMEIYGIMNDEGTSNVHLMKLIEETGDRYIETDNIVDKNGNNLREPLNKVEVREEKINKIIK
jgi:hypothetical protein